MPPSNRATNDSKYSRTRASVNARLDSQLISYVAAAAGSGVALLSMSPSAAAEIVYTPANVSVNGSYALDLNHDGLADFTFHQCRCATSTSHIEGLFLAFDVKGNAVRPPDSGYGSWAPAALPIGVRIGPGARFASATLSNAGARMAVVFEYGTFRNSWGVWVHSTNRFLGLKFLVDGEFHYGWARVTVSGTSATLTGYAYETQPNTQILAGQRTESSNKEVAYSPLSFVDREPSEPTLGLLARGAYTLDLWRRREEALA